jgi:hypothetical protein
VGSLPAAGELAGAARAAVAGRAPALAAALAAPDLELRHAGKSQPPQGLLLLLLLLLRAGAAACRRQAAKPAKPARQAARDPLQGFGFCMVHCRVRHPKPVPA